MMAIDQVKRESRSVNFLLWKYKTKQPGEINPENVDLKKEWRENQKIRTAITQMDDLKITGDLQQQVLWILTEGPRTKDLCALKLAVSYADKDQKHLGGIYQAGNWIYVGLKNQNTTGASIIKIKKYTPDQLLQWGESNH
ncbi:hypothetical protein [Methanobacterium sp.]|uniref:Mom family adenine methylcarbamoylation protein n=1 Tax=Methanobacterium sp. TaxID=2164 RepID=UPI0025CBCB45|nr:hypothetical protein [Methanobacterium sp.]MBI5459207.1 hypothetical protein [Methanobacterium sp.]